MSHNRRSIFGMDCHSGIALSPHPLSRQSAALKERVLKPKCCWDKREGIRETEVTTHTGAEQGLFSWPHE